MMRPMAHHPSRTSLLTQRVPEPIGEFAFANSPQGAAAFGGCTVYNAKLVSTADGQVAQEILGEFEELWSSEHTHPWQEVSAAYDREWIRNKVIERQRRDAVQAAVVDFDQYTLKPNKMQTAFLANLMKLRESGAKKALFCSATATGKTIASAFALREMGVKKALFLVHREQIAKQAMTSYRRVFGQTITCGLISGNSRQYDADYIFCTMQMMAKPEVHTRFSRDCFAAIVLDEAHHAGSSSYQTIMNYFRPQFWLGMTASPDTNHYDIYDIFDHNIAYDLRLNQALEEDLVCPFHYYGITDLEIDGEVFDDESDLRNFSRLVSDDRVNYVIEQAAFYGYSGDRVKGIVFCRSKEEARELSVKFNERGFRTAALLGEDSQARREEIIERLAMDVPLQNNDPADRTVPAAAADLSGQVRGAAAEDGCLDYIFTVDIFNEGVDIPEINQVIMLRPTESPVVFVQQLGRGLRKQEGKEYVVILDFIGNYANNFMIPIALSGDRSYNKDAMRRYIMEGSRVIPGSSTIHFDEISRSRIYASIDKARTNDMQLLRTSYTKLRNKLGRIPTIPEFREYGSIDVAKIFEKCGSYYNFLRKYEKDYTVSLSAPEQTIVEYFSRKLVSYKRVHELALLQQLITQRQVLSAYYRRILNKDWHADLSAQTERSVVRNLTNEFPKDEERRKYADCVLIEEMEGGGYRLAPAFGQMLDTHSDFREMILDLLDYGLDIYKEKYAESYRRTNLQLYQKYTYEDVCRLLNWERNQNAQNIGGYFYDAGTKTLPVFINYEKGEDAIAYEDRFISENCLIALSKHPRKITSADVTHIYKRSGADRDNRIYLFIRKNKDDNEAKEFYFLGEIFAEGDPHPIYMESTRDDAFEITYRLDVPVRSDLYEYITAG